MTHVNVAGVIFEGRPAYIARMYGNEEIRLVKDPENIYDANAIRVEAKIEDVEWFCIGYLPRSLAERYKNILLDCLNPRINSITRGKTTMNDGDFPHVGITIDFPTR